jgi:FxsC-like protein
VPNFFLSSAAGDDDPYVRQFFDDLRRRVSASSSDRGGSLSYLGTVGNRDTAPHPDMLLRLASCDVFVALTSPRYFRTEACGKQWQAFASRFEPGAERSAMIPVAWAVGGAVPEAAGRPLTPAGDPGRGLRQLVRLKSLRRSYDAFADEIAARIVAAGQASPAPPAEPIADFAAVPDAFAEAAQGTRVHFIVAAASRDTMDQVRRDLDYYGRDALDWAPYVPTAAGSLADRARLLAADQALSAEVAPLAEVEHLDDVLPRLERARAGREIVVILCDWWLTQLDEYQRVLAEIDRRGLGDTAVLVPASRTDEETMDNLAELRFSLRATFRRSTSRSPASLHSEISGADAFDSDLAAVLEEARNRLYRLHATPPAMGDDQLVQRPILRGP